MSSIPTKQLKTLFERIHEKPNYWAKSKSYEAYYDEATRTVMLSHYGTLIFKVSADTYECDFGGAFSVSDRDAINSFARLMGLGCIAYIKDYCLYINNPWMAKSWTLNDDGDLGVCAEGSFDEDGYKAIRISWFTRPDTWPIGVCTEVAYQFIYLDPSDKLDLVKTVRDLDRGCDPVKEGWDGISYENAFKKDNA